MPAYTRPAPVLTAVLILVLLFGDSTPPARALGRQANPPRPCLDDEAYRALDFWVGSWDVYNPDGRKVGTNVIKKELAGCLVEENWTSASGVAGRSVNFYDPRTRTWKQHWVGEPGTVISYEGTFQDGAMRLSGESFVPGQGIERSRMTLTPLPDGRVRQLIEHSKDQGASWYVWFEGLYVRQP